MLTKIIHDENVSYMNMNVWLARLLTSKTLLDADHKKTKNKKRVIITKSAQTFQTVLLFSPQIGPRERLMVPFTSVHTRLTLSLIKK